MTWGKSSCAVAGRVAGTAGSAPALPQAPASINAAIAARRISAFPRAEVIVGVSPLLGLARLERDRDIRLPAEDGLDRPEVDAAERLVGADALAEPGLGIDHLEVVIAGRGTEAGEGRGDGFAFR